MIYLIPKNRKGSPKARETSSLKQQGWNEKALETYLSNHLHEFVGEDFMVIHQSKPFQPDVDLLALDREGDLWFFELKALSSRSAAVLQVFRYSQTTATYSIDDWKQKYVVYCKNDKARDLAVEFCERFAYCSPDAVQHWQDKIGKRHHLVLVADGADEETALAISHWQRHGLDVQLWPYRIYAGGQDRFQMDFPDLYIKGRRIGRDSSLVFLLNTCRKDGSLDHEKWMIKHAAGMASSDPWMWKINRISTGARVMLYANKVGITCIGIATAEKRSGMIGTSPMRFVKLREFKKLREPLTTKEIYRIGGWNFPVLQTLRQLPENVGDELWQAANERA
jgi:hypothetical protein